MSAENIWIIVESSINLVEVLVDVFFLAFVFPRKLKKMPSFLTTGLFISVYLAFLFCLVEHLSDPVEFLCLILLMLAYTIPFRNGHVGWKICVVVLINSAFVAVNVGSRMLLQLVPGVNTNDLMSLTEFRYVWIAIFHTIYFAILWGIMQVRDAIKLRIPAYNYLMLVFPLYSLIQLVLLDFIIYLDPGPQWESPCMIAAFVTLILDVAIMVMFILNSRKYEEFRQLQNVQLLINQQNSHLQALTSGYEDIRIWRHDIKHQLLAVGVALKTGEYDKAQELIEQSLDGSNTVLKTPVNSGNVMIDGLIAFNDYEVRRNNIKMTLDMTLTEITSISDLDLCRLFGNLLDNAIEACMRIENESERYIKVIAVPQNANIFIKVINSTTGVEKRINNTFLSVKNKGKHDGLGLKSIDQIVSSTGGFLERMHENKVFKTIILLPCAIIDDVDITGELNASVTKYCGYDIS